MLLDLVLECIVEERLITVCLILIRLSTKVQFKLEVKVRMFFFIGSSYLEEIGLMGCADMG